MASNGVGSSRSSKGVKASSSSVDWLTRDLVEMRIRDKVETDDERVSLALLIYFESHFHVCSIVFFSLKPYHELTLCEIMFQDSEPDIIDGAGTEPGHVIRTTVRGRNGQSRQVGLLWRIDWQRCCYLTLSKIFYFFD